MARIYPSITELIGRTPLVKLGRLARDVSAPVAVKLESFNPAGSVKDRIGLALLEEKKAQGALGPGTRVVEATSGNTGIGLAAVCATWGVPLVLVMPESMSVERRALLRAFGAELILTPAREGMPGAVKRVEEMVADDPSLCWVRQFDNPANPEVHRRTTAEEIWEDTEGAVEIFVAGVGTGGTITGVGERLKEKKPGVEVIAVEPADSPVLSGGTAGPHKIQGIGAGFVPGVLNSGVIDEVVKVSNDAAFQTARRLAVEEGILAGISSGANVWAALEVAGRKENRGRLVVTMVCDTGERYLSLWTGDSGL